MSIIAALRQMLAAGMPLDHALTAAEIMEAAPSLKSKGAERQRRWRDRLEASRETHETVETTGDAGDERDVCPLPLPPLPQTPSPPTPSPTEGQSRSREAVPARTEFDAWWAVYPHKVGKGDAERKFAAARKLVSLAVLIAGVDEYRRSKPPDREWCNPAVWLHQQRWTDQPDHIAPRLPHDRPGPHPPRTAPDDRSATRTAVWTQLRAEEDAARAGGPP